MRPRTRATLVTLAVGTAALLAFPAAKGGHHQPPATTTTQASTTSTSTTSTTPSTSSSATVSDPATFAASLGFHTLNTTVSDEFDGLAGAKPSFARWDAKQFTATNGSVVYWNGYSNVTLDGAGHLDIAAVRQANGQWFSAWLSGKTAYSGPRFVVARAKVPGGLGPWSGPVWELDAPYGAHGLELDVAEQLGWEPTSYHTTAHANASTQVSDGNDVAVALADGYHDYEAAVYVDHVDFYLDGRYIRTITAAQLGSWAFTTTPMVLNVDLDMGGWGGMVDPSLPSPQHELVDFERVYTP